MGISCKYDTITRSQSCVHIKVSVVCGVRELLNLSITQPPVLNAESLASIEIRMPKTCFTIFREYGVFTGIEFPLT